MTHPHDRALEAAAIALCYASGNEPFLKFTDGRIVWQEYTAHARAAVTAYLDALQETHALVPRDPTSQMIVAGVAERHGQPVPEAWSLATVNIYRAMIDAAPPAAQDPRA